MVMNFFCLCWRYIVCSYCGLCNLGSILLLLHVKEYNLFNFVLTSETEFKLEIVVLLLDKCYFLQYFIKMLILYVRQQFYMLFICSFSLDKWKIEEKFFSFFRKKNIGISGCFKFFLFLVNFYELCFSSNYFNCVVYY